MKKISFLLVFILTINILLPVNVLAEETASGVLFEIYDIDLEFGGEINVVLVDESNNVIEEDSYYGVFRADGTLEEIYEIKQGIGSNKQRTGRLYIAEVNEYGNILSDLVEINLTKENSPLDVYIYRQTVVEMEFYSICGYFGYYMDCTLQIIDYLRDTTTIVPMPEGYVLLNLQPGPYIFSLIDIDEFHSTHDFMITLVEESAKGQIGHPNAPIRFTNHLKTLDFEMYLINENSGQEMDDKYLDYFDAVLVREADAEGQYEITSCLYDYKKSTESNPVVLRFIPYGNYSMTYSINHEDYLFETGEIKFQINDDTDSINLYFTQATVDECCCSLQCEEPCDCDCADCLNKAEEPEEPEEECCCGEECEGECDCSCEDCPNLKEPEPIEYDCCCENNCTEECDCSCEDCPNLKEPEPTEYECCCEDNCTEECDCSCEDCPNLKEPEPIEYDCCCEDNCTEECDCSCENCPNLKEPEPIEYDCCCEDNCTEECDCSCEDCLNLKEPEPIEYDCCCENNCTEECDCSCEDCPNLKEPEPTEYECCCEDNCTEECDCSCEDCPNLKEPEPIEYDCCCEDNCTEECDCSCEDCPNLKEPEPIEYDCCCEDNCTEECDCSCENCPNIKEEPKEPEDRCCCSEECEGECECDCEKCLNKKEDTDENKNDNKDGDNDTGGKGSSSGGNLSSKRDKKIKEDIKIANAIEESNDNFILNISNTHIAYIAGYPDGTVKPLNNITRAEIASILYRLMTEKSKNKYYGISNTFTDIVGEHWANIAISTISQANVISGYEDGTFRPNGNITRAELSTMLAMIFDNEETKIFQMHESHWAFDNLTFVAEKGWLLNDKYLNYPDEAVTRAETIFMINRVLGRYLEDIENLNENHIINWQDNDRDSWYYLDIIEATHTHEAKKRI